jgi:hypothetical protein
MGRQFGGIETAGALEKGDEEEESLPVSATLEFNQENKRTTSIVLHADISEPERQAALAAKENAVLRGDDGNQSITLRYGGHRQLFSFPFPVDTGSAKVRVARKSSYLEVCNLFAKSWRVR